MKSTRKSVPWIAAAFSLLVAGVLVMGAAAAPDAFLGKWYSVDLPDLSNQALTIGGGPGDTYFVRYRDFGASVCEAPVGGVWAYGASAKGFLTRTGDTLSGPLTVYCLKSPPEYYSHSTFTFTLSGDTLVQTEPAEPDVVWYR